MSRLVELYVQELTKDPPAITLRDVPAGLRKAVEKQLKGSSVKKGGAK